MAVKTMSPLAARVASAQITTPKNICCRTRISSSVISSNRPCSGPAVKGRRNGKWDWTVEKQINKGTWKVHCLRLWWLYTTNNRQACKVKSSLQQHYNAQRLKWRCPPEKNIRISLDVNYNYYVFWIYSVTRNNGASPVVLPKLR